ncbi:MAG: hypothetical protein ACTSX6_01295 [Candidatus Heimdallarchaeaceae archaeon]
MSKLPSKVYCFACGKQFEKTDPEGFEPCPHCGKGLTDLSEDAQFAVKMVMKSIIEHFRD